MNDWRPFIYGGLASVAAECGEFPLTVPLFLFYVRSSEQKEFRCPRIRGRGNNVSENS